MSFTQNKTSYEQFKDDQKKTAWGCLTIISVLLALVFPLLWVPIVLVMIGLVLKKYKK